MRKLLLMFLFIDYVYNVRKLKFCIKLCLERYFYSLVCCFFIENKFNYVVFDKNLIKLL